MTAPHIDQLRQHLLDTLTSLRDRDNPMEPDLARAVAQVAGVLVDSAKVEVEYIRVTGTNDSAFIARKPDDTPPAIADSTTPTPTAHNPFPSRVHRLEG